tara:strand:- start:4589 stop:5473 length:885 start_codon:yes stop_codon:yes gene_type:complete
MEREYIHRKGIILAGGTGTRLYPVTQAINKQLMPVYDKPMIYYPLSTLMLAGIKDILIITAPGDNENFRKLLGSGENFGINISYEIQQEPKGLAEAFIIGEKFIGDSNPVLILGDNIFYGTNLQPLLSKAMNRKQGATLFAYHVNDPSKYGVVEFDINNNIISINEKPDEPKSSFAVTGLYFYDNSAIEIAKNLLPSSRGELEITDLNNAYLKKKLCKVELMGRGYAWLDTGSHDTLIEAAQFISTIEKRQGLKISCPEEISFLKGWIDKEKVVEISKIYNNNDYGKYLLSLVN